MAYADGRLFVPVVELCSQESAVTPENAFARDPAEGKGALYALDAATGRTVWRRQLASPPFGCATVANDAVVVPTYDGRVSLFAAATAGGSGRRNFRPATTAARPSAKDVLIVAAGAKVPNIAHPVTEVVAYSPSDEYEPGLHCNYERPRGCTYAVASASATGSCALKLT